MMLPGHNPAQGMKAKPQSEKQSHRKEEKNTMFINPMILHPSSFCLSLQGSQESSLDLCP